MNDDEAERNAKLLAAKNVERLVERQAEALLFGWSDPGAAFEHRSNPLRDLYIAKYGSEAAADARLAEEARQDAVRARQASNVQFPTTESAGAGATAAPAREALQAWRTKDLWSERELQDLCCGRLPDAARASSDAVNEAAEAIRRAVLAGTLPVASEPIDATDGDRFYAHARFFAPRSATEWASSRFSDFPFKPADFGLAPDAMGALTPAASAWPWGAHETELLRHLAAAAQRWWVNFDPTDNTTAPTNAQVSEWLQARGVGKAMADKMATMLRADGLPTGPRT